MTLEDFISAMRKWIIDEENSFAIKLYSFTKNFNKLVKSPEPLPSLDQTLLDWLMDKENFTHACTLLIIAYTKQATSQTTNYHVRVSSGSTTQLFSSWDANYMKRLSLLNVYATHFLAQLNENSTAQTFTDQDLKLTVDLSNGDLDV